MAKKPGPGICVHCLQHVPQRNWDHVFPRGWYPDTTPENLEKWKIPTCKPCNDAYGRIEDELATLLAVCVDPGAAATAGIWKKTRRGLDPRAATSHRDAIARARRRDDLLKKMLHGSAIPQSAIYPGMGERWGRGVEEQVALPIPADSLRRVAEKIVKGLAYLEDGRLIDAGAEIKHHVVHSSTIGPVEEILEKFGVEHSRGPGIRVVRAVTPDDGVSAIYKITIWGEFVLYVSVIAGNA